MMIRSSVPQTIAFFILLIYLTGSSGSNLGVGEPRIRCKEVERQALLRIKQDLYNSTDSKILSSWGKEEEKRECCEWSGISCDSISGHVIKLDLSLDDTGSLFIGNMSSSLADLQDLSYLDLSGNYVDGNFIPSFIGRLTKLRYLNLSYTWLGGEIPPQLGNLSNLQYLDLSSNAQLKIKSLESISHLSSLRLLDLSTTNMSMAHDWVHVVNNLPQLTTLKLSDSGLPDTVPPSLSAVNSSKFLAVLDLSENLLSASVFVWLFNYSRSLVYLGLFHCLSETSIPEAFGGLTALESLHLAGNDLEGSIPNSFGNMTALRYLDLRGGQVYYDIPESGESVEDPRSNRLGGRIPKSFGNMIALEYLDLSGNQLEGSIPQGFGNMAFLQYLDLSNNMLSGEIPKAIWEICALQKFQAYNNSLSGQLQFAESSTRCTHFPLEILHLENNKIVGSLPNFTLYPSLKEVLLFSNQLNGNVSKSIGQLSKLEILQISDNSMVDVISEAHFSNLSKLFHLDFSSNSHIVFDIPSDWIPPFQLLHLKLAGCKLGSYFPKWLLTQKLMHTLNISNSGISDSIPDALWSHLAASATIDLSNNEIRGMIQENQGSIASSLNSIDLSSNKLEGPIPAFLLHANSVNLFNNTFSDINSICNYSSTWLELVFLDVSYNQLSGELPDCWSQVGASLRVLILRNNMLSGKIPTSIGFLTGIQMLHLSNNNLTAELPSSLQNCTDLVIFDVGDNKFLGPVPTWIGKTLIKLVILSLRSNDFNGSVPLELCHLVHLQLLDLSLNNLSGKIPNCLSNITAMKAIWGTDAGLQEPYQRRSRIWNVVPSHFYDQKLFLVWKGALLAFENIELLKNIDLSSNKLSGYIPREITRLVGLVSLNLSRNNLSGQIPQEIGNLESLDVLDLSKNHLFGRIPSSISQIDRLNTLDLSSNNLSGEIPSGPQLHSRDPVAYLGNPGLCGVPLSKCPGEEEPTFPGATKDHAIANVQEEDEFITKGFYISTTVGFIVGLWGVCLTLIFNKSLRYSYFNSLKAAGDWLYVTAALQKAKLLRIIKKLIGALASRRAT